MSSEVTNNDQDIGVENDKIEKDTLAPPPPPPPPIDHLPEEILERIFSFTSQYNDYVNIGLVCKKWYRIILGLIDLNRSTFASCFHTGEIEWQCVSGANDLTVNINYPNQTVMRMQSPYPHVAPPPLSSISSIITTSQQQQQQQQQQPPMPLQRHSHSCAILGHNMYVFGGLSATLTAYNDLWMLDLNTKQWVRPITSGSYPSPKAATTLLARDSNKELILYGGYSHPYSHSFNQQVNFFDECHVFSARKSVWQAQVFTQDTPKLAGHSASLIRNFMILFGGCNSTLGNKSNSVFCLDLETYTWINISSNSNSYTQASTAPASWSSSQPTSSSSASRFIDGPRPDARYGHSQITLDAERILVVGGCGGPNKQFDDAWILHWPLDVNVNARWERVSVRGLINAPVQFYCVPLVQCCGNKLVTFGKPRAPTNQTTTNNSLSLAIDDRNDAADKDVMTIHGAVKQPRLRVCSCSDPISSPSPSTSAPVSTSSSADGGVKPREESKSTTNGAAGKNGRSSNEVFLNKSQLNTVKRLEVLNKLANKFKHPSSSSSSSKPDNIQTSLEQTRRQQLRCVVHSRLMQVFVLDFSKCVSSHEETSEPSVSWQTPIAHFTYAPPETILFSSALGIDEIIVFGGMEIDSYMPNNMRPSYEYVKHRISNKLFVMKPRQLFNIGLLNGATK